MALFAASALATWFGVVISKCEAKRWYRTTSLEGTCAISRFRNSPALMCRRLRVFDREDAETKRDAILQRELLEALGQALEHCRRPANGKSAT